MDFATAIAPERPTPMQIRVLTLSAQGLTGEEIGMSLFISVPTVKLHLYNVRSRLHARNTTHAVVICIAEGYIDLDEVVPDEVVEDLLVAA